MQHYLVPSKAIKPVRVVFVRSGFCFGFLFRGFCSDVVQFLFELNESRNSQRYVARLWVTHFPAELINQLTDRSIAYSSA